jgi:hypothetical protein
MDLITAYILGLYLIPLGLNGTLFLWCYGISISSKIVEKMWGTSLNIIEFKPVKEDLYTVFCPVVNLISTGILVGGLIDRLLTPVLITFQQDTLRALDWVEGQVKRWKQSKLKSKK